MTAYYNEIDPFAAQWLRNLIAAGLIAPGDVDERDIRDVQPDELRGYTQCHFFAGIGVWSHALRLAGWPDDRPIWTGSCPCQPFSAAGGRGGFADERHLWPAFFHLIEAERPEIVLGEQVASKDGLAWLDLVQADLEGACYAFEPLDLCAAGVGAPHIRQRLWFVGVADADDTRLEGRGGMPQRAGERAARPHGLAGGMDDALPTRRPEGWSRSGNGSAAGSYSLGGLADALRGRARNDAREGVGAEAAADRDDGRLSGQRLWSGLESASGGLDNAAGARQLSAGRGPESEARDEARLRLSGTGCDVRGPSPTNGFWRVADWLACTDGKWRPVEPGTFPLAHGSPARVGRLRAYGNAIPAPLAAEFIGAVQHSLAMDLV